MRLPELIGRFREIFLDPFRHLPMVEGQHIGANCGALGEVGGKIEAEA
jgi:hypothetical protein